MEPLQFDARLAEYQRQTDSLLAGWRAGDQQAVRFFWQQHPRFRRTDVVWLPKQLEKADVLKEEMTADDARMAIARWYDFRDWPALAEWVGLVGHKESPVSRFETAVEAVISGDQTILERLLAAHPELVAARSTRIAPFDPPAHRATLLHYVSANGVEGYRERTPPNAVEIAKILLRAGVYDGTPIGWAEYGNRPEIAGYLRSRGAA